MRWSGIRARVECTRGLQLAVTDVLLEALSWQCCLLALIRATPSASTWHTGVTLIPGKPTLIVEFEIALRDPRMLYDGHSHLAKSEPSTMMSRKKLRARPVAFRFPYQHGFWLRLPVPALLLTLCHVSFNQLLGNANNLMEEECFVRELSVV